MAPKGGGKVCVGGFEILIFMRVVWCQTIGINEIYIFSSPLKTESKEGEIVKKNLHEKVRLRKKVPFLKS